MGNLRKIADGKSQVTAFTFDDRNQLNRTDFPDTNYETRSYDTVGNLVSKRDPRGNTLTYQYDELDRLTRITYPDASTVTYTWDKNGNRLSMVDRYFTTTYTYDPRNRLKTEGKTIDGTDDASLRL